MKVGAFWPGIQPCKAASPAHCSRNLQAWPRAEIQFLHCQGKNMLDSYPWLWHGQNPADILLALLGTLANKSSRILWNLCQPERRNFIQSKLPWSLKQVLAVAWLLRQYMQSSTRWHTFRQSLFSKEVRLEYPNLHSWPAAFRFEIASQVFTNLHKMLHGNIAEKISRRSSFKNTREEISLYPQTDRRQDCGLIDEGSSRDKISK